MARKPKAPTKKQHVPLEDRPEFFAAAAAFPSATEVDALESLAADSLALFNDAVRGNMPEQAELAMLRYEAVVYRLHGDSFFGCQADGGSGELLAGKLAAVPGVIPGWGQGGQWLVEVNDMRIRVKVDHGPRDTIPIAFHAVDVDLPFLSHTGFRSHWLRCEDWFGRELGGAVLEFLELVMQVDICWQPVSIAEESRSWVDVPLWLTPAMEGVTSNGQQALPLSGRSAVELPAPIEAEPKVPKSNAERQRDFRKRQREQRELAKADGAVTLSLTHTERCVLSLGLLAHEDLFHRGPNWVTDKKPEFDALLTKLWPEGGDGRYLAEPERSTRRPAAFLRDELEREREIARRLDLDNQRLRQSLNEITAELKALAGGGVASAPVAPSADLVDQLHAKIAGLEKWNAQEIAERAKAFEAVEVLQRRLEKAGLISDYRRQPGE